MLNRIATRSKTWSSVIALVALGGCMELDPATIASKPLNDVCYSVAVAAAGNSSQASLDVGMAELRRRGLFTERELAHIARGEAVIGMSEAAGICALGAMYDAVNETTVAGATAKQYVFGTGGYGGTRYLYTTNGVVSGYQRASGPYG